MEEKKERILAAAMQGVRLNGLYGVRIQHISKLAGCVNSCVYNYFNNKDDLLSECFARVDRQIAHIFEDVRLDPELLDRDPEEALRLLWTPFFQWLIDHPDETVFYHRYQDGPGFHMFQQGWDGKRFAPLLQTLRLFEKKYRLHIDRRVLLLHVLSNTVTYAKHLVEGELPNTPEIEESIFQLIMHGLDGVSRRTARLYDDQTSTSSATSAPESG